MGVFLGQKLERGLAEVLDRQVRLDSYGAGLIAAMRPQRAAALLLRALKRG